MVIWFLLPGPSKNVASNDGNIMRLEAVISDRAYQPSSFDVPLGTTVALNIKNRDTENHGLIITELGVEGGIGPLNTKTIQLVADTYGLTSTYSKTTHPLK